MVNTNEDLIAGEKYCRDTVAITSHCFVWQPTNGKHSIICGCHAHMTSDNLKERIMIPIHLRRNAVIEPLVMEEAVSGGQLPGC